MLELEIDAALEQFKSILVGQLERVDQLKNENVRIDFMQVPCIRIGVCGGDGIGPIISSVAQRILSEALKEYVSSGKVEIVDVEGLTIENRVAEMKAIPDKVLANLKDCHVILKGPTTTPQKGDAWPNIESANVAMRKELDLFANVRPVKKIGDRIDWIFFRENTEGEYIVGSQGFDVTSDLSVDFKITTEQGSERIIRMAFEYARLNNKQRVTVVTKSNVVKTTDGRFSSVAKRIAQEYVQYGITSDEWYIDIMTAKLLDPERRHQFEVLVMPNLYGDIITDEAAQIQGGVGTAGSANLGNKWAMFEAVHGSAPRMILEGRGQYADPASMIKAAAMLARHIGFPEAAERIEKALEICVSGERRLVITGRPDGATASEFGEYILEWMNRCSLDQDYDRYLLQ
ncbi:isocitrate/isopropylmalate dehydrogenase family protein [bacterium]|nr:isocitrate/isopropylmalate dehydrogenase family protein [bacterium]